jgi:hypothetical protein
MSNYQKDYVGKFMEQYTFGLINVQDLAHRIAVYAEYVNALEEYKELYITLTKCSDKMNGFEESLDRLADVKGTNREGM